MAVFLVRIGIIFQIVIYESVAMVSERILVILISSDEYLRMCIYSVKVHPLIKRESSNV